MATLSYRFFCACNSAEREDTAFLCAVKGTTENKLKLNITLGAELGYEWEFKNKQSLGLGVYANYGLYSMFKQNAQDLKSLITVTPSIPSTVTTNSATEAWTEKQGFVDVGIKLAYHFNWWKTKARK